MSFGNYISERRKELYLSQRELAKMVKKMDGKPITPQYLNDIEHGRRNPPSEFLLKGFAKALEVDFFYLSYLAGIIPKEIVSHALPKEQVIKYMRAFRKGKENIHK